MNFETSFLLHELVHFSLTSAVAVLVWWRFRDWRLIVAAFLFGVFIDGDHLLDYFAYFGWHFNLNEFLNGGNFMEKSGKIYIPLHGWEYLPLLWLAASWLGKILKIKGLEWAVTLAYLGHLGWDQFTYGHNPGAYFIIYRFFHHFSTTIFW